jgi:hypothetical protein
MALNPLHANRGPSIYLVAIIRYTDKTVVAHVSVSNDVTKEGVRELIASNGNCQEGKRYSAIGESQSIHYTLDQNGRIYGMVTEPKYSARVAFAALEELIGNCQKEFGYRIAAATEGSLSKTARPILQDWIEKYSSPANFDKLTAVQEKVDIVKTVMKDNSKYSVLLLCTVSPL